MTRLIYRVRRARARRRLNREPSRPFDWIARGGSIKWR